MKPRYYSLLLAALLLLSLHAQADVKITDAWVRASNPGQTVGAAYMTLTSSEDNLLFAADTDAAGSVEIHSMEMKNGVMKMRMLDELALKANKPAKLYPGGYHLMLFDLKKPLKEGDQVELTLCFKDKQGKETHQTMLVPVKQLVR